MTMKRKTKNWQHQENSFNVLYLPGQTHTVLWYHATEIDTWLMAVLWSIVDALHQAYVSLCAAGPAQATCLAMSY